MTKTKGLGRGFRSDKAQDPSNTDSNPSLQSINSDAATAAPGSAEIISSLEAEMRDPKISIARSAALGKIHDRLTNAELPQLRADLSEARDRAESLDVSLQAALALVMTLESDIAEADAEIERLEAEKLAYLAACPACAVKQIEIDRTAEAAASHFAQVAKELADANAAKVQAQKDERKRARFTELITLVTMLVNRYDRGISLGPGVFPIIDPLTALPGKPLYLKREKYSDWPDEAKQKLSNADRHNYAKGEHDDNIVITEYLSLKQELKDGATWGPETMELIKEEVRLEKEAAQSREAQKSREAREAKEPKVEYGGPGFNTRLNIKH